MGSRAIALIIAGSSSQCESGGGRPARARGTTGVAPACGRDDPALVEGNLTSDAVYCGPQQTRLGSVHDKTQSIYRSPRAARDRVPDAGRLVSVLAAQLRDTERAIKFWRQKASECGGLHPSTAFELSRMSSGAWSHRFVICAAAVVNELAFLIYGSRFAKLLELPERPTRGIPITRQLPGRYLTLFTEGCRHAIAQGAPVRLSGVVVDYGQIELYRAAFMPLAMQLTSSKQLVFGTFNRRIGPKASSSDAIRTTYNWLFENIQADRGPRPS